MEKMNTRNFSIFLKSGATLPVAPANFLEVSDKVFLNPKPKVESYERFNGTLLTKDTFADTCDTTQEGVTLTHLMRFSNNAQDALGTPPAYAEMLKIGGFTETIDTTTPGQETVTYTLNKNSSPSLGSGLYYIDGYKQSMTNTIAMNIAFNLEVGMNAKVTGTMNTFVDNEGIPVAEANPAVTLDNINPLQIVGCTDLYSEDGTQVIGVSKISIDLGAQLQKFYGMSLKEYTTTSFEPTITVDFPLDKSDYANAITLLKNQTYFDIVVEIGRINGVLTSGKSTKFTITNCKLSDFTDADDKDTVKRTHNIALTPESEFTIKLGYFA